MCGLAPFATRVVLSSNDTAAAPGASASGYATVTVREGCPLFPAGASTRGYIHRNSEIVSEPALSSAPGGPARVGSRRTTRNVVDSPPSRRRGSRGAGARGSRGRGPTTLAPPPASVARRGPVPVPSPSPPPCVEDEPKPAGNDLGRGLGRVEGYAWRNVVTSYARLHFGDAPELAQHFVDACRAVPAGAAEAALKAASAMRKTPPSTQGSVPSTPQLGRVASTDSLQLQMQLQHTPSEGSLSGGGGHGPGDGSGDATPAGAGTPSNKSGYAGSSGGHTPAGESSSQLAPRDEKYRPAHRRAHASDDVDGGGAMGAGAGAMGAGIGEEPIGRGALEPLPAARIRLLRRRTIRRREQRPTNGVVRDAERPRPRGGALVPARVRASTVASMVGLSAGDEYGDVGHLHSPCETPQPARRPERARWRRSRPPRRRLCTRWVSSRDSCASPIDAITRRRLRGRSPSSSDRDSASRTTRTDDEWAGAEIPSAPPCTPRRARAPATRPRGTSALPSARPSTSSGFEGFGRDWC